VLFEPICHLYERISLLVIRNLPFRGWYDIFGSMTVAAVDQLVPHFRIIGITGDCYRQNNLRQGFPANRLTCLRN
jgi:DNA replication protein DnaC